jgi:hypothetical protein
VRSSECVTDEAELPSGLRKGQVVKSGRVFSHISVKKMGNSGVDVARFPGITTSSVNGLAVFDEVPAVEKYVYVVLEPMSPFTKKSCQPVFFNILK